MKGWMPIESAPDKLSVIVFEPKAQWVTLAYAENGCWSDERCEEAPIFPTHWMPLPDPPSE